MARLKKKKREKKGKLGSGKPYDGCSEVEVTLVIPVVSWGWRRDEGEEEERIRTEEQVVRQKAEPRGQIFVCFQGHWEEGEEILKWGPTILTSGSAIALIITYSILSRAWGVAGEEGR